MRSIFSPRLVSHLVALTIGALLAGMLFVTATAPYLTLLPELVMVGSVAYALTMLALVTMPRHRRGEVFRAATLLAPCVAMMRMVATAHHDRFVGVLVAILGVFLAAAPLMIERLRVLARDYGGTCFETIVIEESRKDRRARRSSAPRGNRSSREFRIF